MTTKWDLSFIYKGFNDPKIDEDLQTADQLADGLTKYRGKLSTMSADELVELIQKYEGIREYLARTGAFGSLLFSQETTKEEFKALYGKVQQKTVDIYNKLIWISLEINKMEKNVFDNFLKEKALSNYKHFLEVLRLKKPYVLTEEVGNSFFHKDRFDQNSEILIRSLEKMFSNLITKNTLTIQ